ncbi:MAG: response regulator [Candidatus Omnitrophica bacterium]|nr:response regulator [Candidatus Omnitrophota bacterium]
MRDKPLILIVDDIAENLDLLESIIEDTGVDIVRATSGEEAIQKTLEHDFALILLDVIMPGLDGFEAAKIIRQNKQTETIPIIFVTAKSFGQNFIFKGYASGAVDYLCKPLEPEIIRSKAKVFIQLYTQKEELNHRMIEYRELSEDIKETLEDLQQFKEAAIDRENIMIELKKEINELNKELGRAVPHDLSFLDDEERN